MTVPGFLRAVSANCREGWANPLFCNIFAKNCMKVKEFGPRGGAGAWRPLKSATAIFKDFVLFVLPYFSNTGFRCRKGLKFVDIVSGDSKLPNQMFFFILKCIIYNIKYWFETKQKIWNNLIFNWWMTSWHKFKLH